MKNKFALIMAISFILLAALACRLPFPLLPSTDTSTATLTPELILEVETEPATVTSTETPTNTPTDTPTTTPTETTEPEPAVPVFSSPVIFRFEMFSPQDGWATTQDGNHLLRTEDGGQTWMDVTPAGLDPISIGMTSLNLDPFFWDAKTAWFSPYNPAGSELFHTQDGGVTWQVNPVPFDNARYFFLDLSIGYGLVSLGAGAGSHYVALYRTVDGGITWVEVFSHEPGESKSLPESGSKNGITFRGVDHGWVGGAIPMSDYFYLHYTEDGGTSWSLETDISLPGAFSNAMLDVWQPIFISASSAFLPVRALGLDSEYGLLIFRSDDYGQTWTFQSNVENGRAVDFISVDEGWMAADLALYHTVDGGTTWSSVLTAGIPAGTTFLKVNFFDSQHGWALTTPDSDTWEPLIFYRTTDGGENWEQLLP
jgi:photosystem II stability/assembly factor-like uncharacterized protein